MVSYSLRKGSTSTAVIDPPRTIHDFQGAVNERRCAVCRVTPIQAQLLPFLPCTPPAPRLPFDRKEPA